jgi:GNAT superfamily N-acetyltransferase
VRLANPLPSTILPVPIDELELERICAVGWPGTESATIGDWLLRAGHGFTRRANSALSLGSAGADVDTAIAAVTAWYAERGLPAVFQQPTGAGLPAAVTDLDDHLAATGWSLGDQVAVLVAELPDVLGRCTDGRRPAGAPTITVAPEPDADWLSLSRYRGQPLPTAAIEVLLAGPAPTFLSMRRDGAVIGVARGVVADGWLGVTAVTVAESARRSGVGTAVLAGLLGWAADHGAGSVYLQTERGNAPALALYGRLGFTEHHGYHYRLAPDSTVNP